VTWDDQPRTRPAPPTPGRCSPPIPSAIWSSYPTNVTRTTTVVSGGAQSLRQLGRALRVDRHVWLQVVHPDLWDLRRASAATLVTVQRRPSDSGGRTGDQDRSASSCTARRASRSSRRTASAAERRGESGVADAAVLLPPFGPARVGGQRGCDAVRPQALSRHDRWRA
jgi:hypothetical protein